MAIKNIADFVKELQKIKIRSSELFFRGHSDVEFKLEPSIYRNRKLINAGKNDSKNPLKLPNNL
jgi:flagellar motor protein MotB